MAELAVSVGFDAVDCLEDYPPQRTRQLLPRREPIGAGRLEIATGGDRFRCPGIGAALSRRSADPGLRHAIPLKKRYAV
jgi:hypothetical protein